MTTTMKPSALDRIARMEQEAQEAAQKRAEYIANGGSGKSAYILRMENVISLAANERVLVRPLYNIPDIFIRRIHDMFKNVAADGSKDPLCHMCAEEQGQPCQLCAEGHNDKKELRDEAFIPVGLYHQQSDASGEWRDAPYVDKEGQSHIKRGWRFLRVKASSPIFQQLMSVFKDADYGKDITCCDFEIVRRGSGMNDTTYTCTPKPPKPMLPKMAAGKPSLAQFEAILNDCFPIRVLEKSVVAKVPFKGPDPLDVHPVNASGVSLDPQEDDFEF